MSIPPSFNTKDFHIRQIADLNNAIIDEILKIYLFGGQLALNVALLGVHAQGRLEALIAGLEKDWKNATEIIASKVKSCWIQLSTEVPRSSETTHQKWSHSTA